MDDRYEFESCEGCLFSAGVIETDGCKVYALPQGHHKCDLFHPNLYAREVRAMEAIAEISGCLRGDGHGGLTFNVTQ